LLLAAAILERMGDNGMAVFAHIVGWGMSVPPHVMTNEDWAKLVDTSDEWIRSRTGVVERRIAGEGETTLTMSLEASRHALEVARLSPANLDLIIVATATPEHIFPSTACLLQDALGAPHAGAFDLSAGCSGFVYALAMAADSIRAGSHNNVLVIGAETLSRVLNWEDRGTSVLFGDGAGAVVVSGSNAPGGILSTTLGSDGSGGDYLIIPAGGSKLPASAETVAQNLHTIQMNGREVYKFATRIMDKAVRVACERANVSLQDIELVVPHQANDRIIQVAARNMGLPYESFFLNLDRYGNTSAATIPIALCEAVEAGRVSRGDHLALVGFGAGLTWAAAIVQWELPLSLTKPPWWRHWLNGLYYVWAKFRSGWLRVQRRLTNLFSKADPED
jgi:3-oxoacyl-[acyl-carrier-protein] synthase III